MDNVETECSRLKQRCDSLEKQLEFVNTQLSEEREQTQVSLGFILLKLIALFSVSIARQNTLLHL